MKITAASTAMTSNSERRFIRTRGPKRSLSVPYGVEDGQHDHNPGGKCYVFNWQIQGRYPMPGSWCKGQLNTHRVPTSVCNQRSHGGGGYCDTTFEGRWSCRDPRVNRESSKETRAHCQARRGMSRPLTAAKREAGLTCVKGIE